MRIWTTIMLATCLLPGAAQSHPLAGQRSEVGVAVIRDGDRESERTAHRLKIPLQQLQQARMALQEATQTLHQIDVDQIGEGKQIPALWVRLQRRQAVASLEALLKARSSQVRGLEEGASYEKLLSWAVEVASRIAELDPSAGLQVLRSWPAPYEWMGESAAASFDKLHSEMESDSFSERFAHNAAQAIKNILTSSNAISRYSSQLARIQQSQDSQKANQFMDGILSELRQASDYSQLRRWTNLARRARNLPHDRTAELMEAVILANSRAQHGSSDGQIFIFQESGREVTLDWNEYQVIRSLRSFSNQPETLIQVLDQWPEIKQAVDRLGGLDRSLRARAVAVQQAGQASPYDYSANRQARQEAQDLFQELKSNTFSRPWWVRQQLEAIGLQDEEGFQQLLGLFRSSQRRFPELAELVAERIKPMLEESDDVAVRLKRFASFAKLSAQFEGRLPAELIQQGFDLIDEIEKARQEGALASAEPSNGRQTAHPQTRQLESFLIAEWALSDFDSALNEVRRQQSPTRRLQLLTAMIRRLSGQNPQGIRIVSG